MKVIRSEDEVWEDLRQLTRQPGYVYAIATLCERDNLILYRGGLNADDMQPMFRRSRLNRPEQNTLLGLMVQGNIDWTEPDATGLAALITRTDILMAELHDALSEPMRLSMSAEIDGESQSFISGSVVREASFYTGESAYSFQYREMARERYAKDDAWLVQNKGFTVEHARSIAKTMCALMDDKATTVFHARRAGSPALTTIQIFEQSPSEISFHSNVPMANVLAFLDAFTLVGANEIFQKLSDYNALAGTPLIPMPHGNVLLFQHYAIYEAIYDSPFYWMIKDDAYKGKASSHRGAFTEDFVAHRLSIVFGSKHVHKNVHIHRQKGKEPGEIDVLVVYGDRLIIVQAKSKRLTLEARAGSDGAIKRDFAGAIQAAYDQAKLCSEEILAGNFQLKNESDQVVNLPAKPKEIFIFCVVSDHYPALAFQSGAFLKHEETNAIRPPYVMDVFLLDTMTEMLNTPLRLLSYVRLRVASLSRLMLSHEHTALSFHLRRNLWLGDEYDGVLLEDDIAADLDAAMTVRRENFPGERTPKGILTRMSGTMFEQLVRQLEDEPHPAALELGFHLLELNEDACQNIHVGLVAITDSARRDGKRHDFSIGGTDQGITFHCNPRFSIDAQQFLMGHCEMRKYATRARRWMGVSLAPDGRIQFCGVVEFPWAPSEYLDNATVGMSVGVPARTLGSKVRESRPAKLGRNDPCSCGSGLKYKKCCLTV